MALPYHEQRCLRRIRRSVARSDPHLSAMLIIFTRLCAGEKMPRRERLSRCVPRAIRALVPAAWAATRVAALFLLRCGGLARHGVDKAARLHMPRGRRQGCGADGY